jgi:iron(III) transport system substrate-binding protein
MRDPRQQRDDAIRRNNFVFFRAGLPLLICGILALILIPMWSRQFSNVVVVYTSQDQEFAEPIFAEFTKKTGIKTRVVYDSEAVKTVGLVNRLITEKSHPQCDLFWNNEEYRTRHLAASGVVQRWERFGFRTRCLVINTNRLSLSDAPTSLMDLTNARYAGKVALAYPLFGTTSTHFLVLRQRWGREKWETWCQALMANKPMVVDGNSVVVKQVGRGEAVIGLTDSDDVFGGLHEGLPIVSIPLREDGLRLGNSVGLIVNAPHLQGASQLFDFLKSDEVLTLLRKSGAIEPANTGDGGEIPIDWDEIVRSQPVALDFIKKIFLR